MIFAGIRVVRLRAHALLGRFLPRLGPLAERLGGLFMWRRGEPAIRRRVAPSVAGFPWPRRLGTPAPRTVRSALPRRHRLVPGLRRPAGFTYSGASRSAPFSPLGRRCPSGRMRGPGASQRPSSGASRHLLPGEEKGKASRPWGCVNAVEPPTDGSRAAAGPRSSTDRKRLFAQRDPGHGRGSSAPSASDLLNAAAHACGAADQARRGISASRTTSRPRPSTSL